MVPDYLSTIVVDFDDTICVFNAEHFNEDLSCSGLVPGAKEHIIKLAKVGFRIVISSARNNSVFGGFSGKAHRNMHRFLEDNGIPYDHIDLGTDGKPIAYRYVDDKAIGCPKTESGIVDWPRVYELIMKDAHEYYGKLSALEKKHKEEEKI